MFMKSNVWNLDRKNRSMPYSESDSDFNFAINSVSDFDSTSESESSELDSSSPYMNLDICIFFTLYLHSSK